MVHVFDKGDLMVADAGDAAFYPHQHIGVRRLADSLACLFQSREKRDLMNRLHQVLHGRYLKGFQRIFPGGSHEDDDRLVIVFSYMAAQFYPVHQGHHDIQQIDMEKRILSVPAFQQVKSGAEGVQGYIELRIRIGVFQNHTANVVQHIAFIFTNCDTDHALLLSAGRV
jgi:hypothetical protein